MSSYLSALKLYYIDCYLSLEAFDIPYIALIIKGGKRLFLKKKATRLPITKDILEKDTKNEPIDLNKLNIDKTFKLAWVGFLPLGEITYTGTEFKKASFLDTKVTRSNVSFSKENQYIVLCLRQSQTNTKHTGTQIILVATSEKTCPVTALSRIYTLDP